MRMNRWILIAVICTGALGTAHAEKGQTELSLEPGIAMPMSTAGDYAGNSFELDGSHFYDFHEVAAFGWELGYLFSSKLGGTLPTKMVSTLSNGNPNPGNLSFSSDLSMSILHVTPEFKFGPTLACWQGKLNPFLVGGGGIYWTHYQSGTITLASGPLAYSGGNDVNGGFNVGGGVSMQFPQNFSIGAEVRYHHIYYAHGVNDTSLIIPALRLTLLF